MKKKLKIIAECIAEAGYGTDSYNRVTNECTHSCYAYITKIISNPDYWARYDDDHLNESLNRDFNLGFNFKKYKLIVFENKSKTKELI